MSAARGRREWILDTLLWAALSMPVAYNQISHAAVGSLLTECAALAVAVGLSRRLPLVSAILVVAGTLVDGNFLFGIPVMGYLAGRRTDRIAPAVVVLLLLTVGGTLINLVVLDPAPAQLFLLVVTLLSCGAFPWLVGRYQTQHTELVNAGWERAAQLERERQMVAAQARLHERTRIAQEIHDSLGHELALLALRASALETAADLAAHHRAAARSVRKSAADATDRLQEAIDLLHGDGTAAPLTPGGHSPEDLVARARDSGVAATLSRTGPSDDLSQLADRAVYRLVQESLTNATRHAPGAAVHITLRHTPDATTAEVVNDPPPAGLLPGARQPDRLGVGLVGLRERVRLAGGTLRAGRRQDGSFAVEAWIPHHAVPPADEEVAVTTELQQAQRRLRRRLGVAVAAPVAVLALVAAGYYPYVALNSTLPDGDYARISIGDTRTSLAGVLPTRQTPDRRNEAFPPTPTGARCEFYTDGSFPVARATYRLCFNEDRLVAKDAVR